FTEGGVIEVIRFQFVGVGNGGDGVQTGLRAVDVRDDDGAVQSDDGGVIEFDEAIVHREDLRPIGGFVIFRGAMHGGDAGLEMVFGQKVARGGLREVKHAARDQGVVPLGAVL